MNSQQFSENEPSSEASVPMSPIPRMSADEAREVIDLWLARRDPAAFSDLPSVPDVAEGLDITPQQTQLLLAEVRARRAAQEAQTRQEAERTNLQMLAAELIRRQDESTQQILDAIRSEARSDPARAEAKPREYRSSPKKPDPIVLTPETYPEVQPLSWKGIENDVRWEDMTPTKVSASPAPIVRLPRQVEQFFQAVANWKQNHPVFSALIVIVALWLFIIVIILQALR